MDTCLSDSVIQKKHQALTSESEADVDAAVRVVEAAPEIGEQKAGNLAWLKVHTFRMVNHLYFWFAR